MYFLYSIILSLGFLLMLPMFLLRREKYASGFKQRLGNYPVFEKDGRDTIWLHCVSVGETNAARPLVEGLRDQFPDHRLVISTTTRTGHELAMKLFTKSADAIIYFPFDWKFSVRRAMRKFRPSLVLLMETEIWPRFIREAKLSGAMIAIVNGRLSQRSFDNYSRVRGIVGRILSDIDLALMQTEAYATRIKALGMDASRVSVTGNLKFEQSERREDIALSDELRQRFDIKADKPLIIAASTHEPEERHVLESLKVLLGDSCRLMIAPRHPERFDTVAKLLRDTTQHFARRTARPSDSDKTSDIILLDSIGELRSVYRLAEIVFVGGSLIPHGGQSILEPAAEGKAIVTGPHTHNFEAVVKEFIESDAIVQLPARSDTRQTASQLSEVFAELLRNKARREELGRNAASLMAARRDATRRTIELLHSCYSPKKPETDR